MLPGRVLTHADALSPLPAALNCLLDCAGAAYAIRSQLKFAADATARRTAGIRKFHDDGL